MARRKADMPVRPVRLLGDPVLRTPAAPVADVDDGVRALIRDLFDTMYAEDGVGLAAPQVGIGRRVIVVDPRDGETVPFALVNPSIVWASVETDRREEGCLSIPGINDVVERSLRVVAEGLDPDGHTVRVDADGLLARILQHEVDHVDGILFLDRLSPLKRRMALAKWQKVRPAADG
jgi:peptide deformylase